MKEVSTKFLQNILILSLVAPCIEVDISVPSFPDISDYFGISDGMTQMTIAYNFYGLVLACLFQGPLSDSFGRRRMMFLGNGIMVLGAIGCVFAKSIEFLYAARFIQGFGASASMVLTTAIIADKFDSKQAAKLYGMMASALTIFMSSAPVFGSFINEIIGWRGNYGVVALVSIASWLFLYITLPETLKQPHKLNLRKSFHNYGTIFRTMRFWGAALIPSLNYAGHLSFITVASFLSRILHEMEGESCSKAFDICVTKRFLENTVCNCMYLKKRSQNVVKIREKMIAKEYNTNFKFI